MNTTHAIKLAYYKPCGTPFALTSSTWYRAHHSAICTRTGQLNTKKQVLKWIKKTKIEESSIADILAALK